MIVAQIHIFQLCRCGVFNLTLEEVVNAKRGVVLPGADKELALNMAEKPPTRLTRETWVQRVEHCVLAWARWEIGFEQVWRVSDGF